MLLRQITAGLTLATALAVAPAAGAQPVQRLLDALGVSQTVEIMREEGLDYGADLGADMIPGGAPGSYGRAVEDIYDAARMEETVRGVFAEEFGDTDPQPLLEFFTSETGERMIELEISARRAMMEEGVEEAARDRFRDMEAEETAQYERTRRFVEVNDLVEANVEGALNANYMFFLGLADGGAIDMSEDQMIDEVWSGEAETREDTREWVYGYLLLAYSPAGPEALEQYTELSETPEGQAMNTALFTAFDKMYSDISYALGRAVAQAMSSQEL